MTRRTILACTSALLGLALITGLAPEQSRPRAETHAFGVDSVHSTAIFRVHHLGAGQFYGRFNDLSGDFSFVPAEDGSVASELVMAVTIAISSVDTNNENLDRHLKSPDFFNSREYPEMSFRSTSAKPSGPNTYEVTGELTIRDKTRPLTARVEWTGAADMGMGYRCGLDARFTIKRSDFGVMYGVDNGALSDETQIIVGLEGKRKDG